MNSKSLEMNLRFIFCPGYDMMNYKSDKGNGAREALRSADFRHIGVRNAGEETENE